MAELNDPSGTKTMERRPVLSLENKYRQLHMYLEHDHRKPSERRLVIEVVGEGALTERFHMESDRFMLKLLQGYGIRDRHDLTAAGDVSADAVKRMVDSALQAIGMKG